MTTTPKPQDASMAIHDEWDSKGDYPRTAPWDVFAPDNTAAVPLTVPESVSTLTEPEATAVIAMLQGVSVFGELDEPKPALRDTLEHVEIPAVSTPQVETLTPYAACIKYLVDLSLRLPAVNGDMDPRIAEVLVLAAQDALDTKSIEAEHVERTVELIKFANRKRLVKEAGAPAAPPADTALSLLAQKIARYAEQWLALNSDGASTPRECLGEALTMAVEQALRPDPKKPARKAAPVGKVPEELRNVVAVLSRDGTTSFCKADTLELGTGHVVWLPIPHTAIEQLVELYNTAYGLSEDSDS